MGIRGHNYPVWRSTYLRLALVVPLAVFLTRCLQKIDHVPFAPAGVTATGGDGQLTVQWDPVSGATSYNLYWSKSSNDSKTTGTEVTNVTSPYVMTGLTNGTTYYVLVTAVNDTGEGPASAMVSATPESTSPAVPTGVVATAGDSQVTIKWNTVSGATSYNLYWSTTAGVTLSTGTEIAGVSSPYVHKGLTNGTTYYYVVTAANAAGESAQSAESSATPEPPAPRAPTGLSVTPSDGKMALTWTGVTGATGYNVYRSTTSGVATTSGTQINGSTAITTTAYTDTTVTNETTYYYVVTAVNGGGESAASAQVGGTPKTQTPGAPTAVNANPGNAQVTISWSAPTTGGTPSSYNLYWSASPGVTTSTGTKIAGVTSPYVHTGLTDGTTYYYMVTAVTGGVESGASVEVSAVPTLPAPTGLSATGGDAQVTLSWSSVTGATSYNLYWSATAGVTPSTGTKIAGVTSPYVHTGLTNGTTYYYIVTAVSSGVESTASAEVSGTPLTSAWTWVSGSNTINAAGVYGTKGVAASANVPGARWGAGSWIDTGGNLWLFGGAGQYSQLNDLWKFDGSNWTWISGSATANAAGVYGTKGIPDAANVPGARADPLTWIDSSGNMWLFGGAGYGSTGGYGELNDLWKFDGSDWTWISGSTTTGAAGVYGTKGAPNAANVPGARYGSATWIDASGNLWLFGGNSYYVLDDLWKFDGSEWTWVSGSRSDNVSGVYGTKGTPAAANMPGSRQDSVSWIDASGNLWLFGGYGYDSTGSLGTLNDLWKFDGSDWTWVSGSSTIDAAGVYGTKGLAAAANMPGARDHAASSVDGSGNLWLFGGIYANTGTSGFLNDLWKFDGSEWTWISGSNTVDSSGVYGTKGTAAITNIPGPRIGAASWIDSSGNLWLFGGCSYAYNGCPDTHNDLWRYRPLP